MAWPWRIVKGLSRLPGSERYRGKGRAWEEKSASVRLPRCSRMAFWPSTQASCSAQGRPSPQGRCCMMQCVISNGPSTPSTASRRLTSSGCRARRDPPPSPRWFPPDRRGRASPSRERADGAAPRPRSRSCRPSPARRSPHRAPGTPAPAARNAPRSTTRASSAWFPASHPQKDTPSRLHPPA